MQGVWVWVGCGTTTVVNGSPRVPGLAGTEGPRAGLGRVHRGDRGAGDRLAVVCEGIPVTGVPGEPMGRRAIPQ